MSWDIVIGLEIHCQLATRSKIFSSAPTAYGAAPNTQANLIDLGFPGVLPVLNAEAVRLAVTFGLAIGADIAPRSVFARKNYFYPDLPKGYQISQYELPIVSGGTVEITGDDGTLRRINVTRAHLEEDAGKSLHENFTDQSGIDLNRAGTPLIEIVSEPEIKSAREAADYMRRVHELVRYLGISDGNMQEGSFRCDANVSLRKSPDAPLGTRTEIKNLNSFRFIERAIEHEIERQADILEAGGSIVQETRLYDADADETRSMRSKEAAVEKLKAENEQLRAAHEGTQAVKDFLIQKVRAMEESLTAQEENETKVAQQIASDQEVIAFLDARVQALEWQVQNLQQARADLEKEKTTLRNNLEQRTAVLQDMLQFERERFVEFEKDAKGTKKVLVKEIKLCRNQITALTAERDALKEQNQTLQSAVLHTPGGSGGGGGGGGLGERIYA